MTYDLNLILHFLLMLTVIDLCAKFEVSSFIHSRDIRGSQNLLCRIAAVSKLAILQCQENCSTIITEMTSDKVNKTKVGKQNETVALS